MSKTYIAPSQLRVKFQYSLDEKQFPKEFTEYSADQAREKIHQFTELVNTSEKVNDYAGYTLDYGPMAIYEIKGERDEQQDTTCIGTLLDFPTDEREIKALIKLQFKGAVNFLQKEQKETSISGGTTYERVIVDTRDEKNITVITAKAGDGDVFLATQSDSKKIKVKQADWRDKPDAPKEEKRIKAKNGIVDKGRLIRPNQGGSLGVSAGCADFHYGDLVRRKPRIKIFKYARNQQGCDLKDIVINCDGAMEKEHQEMEKSEGTKFIKRNLREYSTLPAHQIAEKMADKAYKKNDSGDNITVGVIKIDELLKMPPGVYHIQINDGHGKRGQIISQAVSDYHANNIFLTDGSLIINKKTLIKDKLLIPDFKEVKNISSSAQRQLIEKIEGIINELDGLKIYLQDLSEVRSNLLDIIQKNYFSHSTRMLGSTKPMAKILEMIAKEIKSYLQKFCSAEVKLLNTFKEPGKQYYADPKLMTSLSNYIVKRSSKGDKLIKRFSKKDKLTAAQVSPILYQPRSFRPTKFNRKAV